MTPFSLALTLAVLVCFANYSVVAKDSGVTRFSPLYDTIADSFLKNESNETTFINMMGNGVAEEEKRMQPRQQPLSFTAKLLEPKVVNTTVGASGCPCTAPTTNVCTLTCTNCAKKCDSNSLRTSLLNLITPIKNSVPSSSNVWRIADGDAAYLNNIPTIPTTVNYNYQHCSCTDTNYVSCNSVCDHCLDNVSGGCPTNRMCKQILTDVDLMLADPSANNTGTVTNINKLKGACSGAIKTRSLVWWVIIALIIVVATLVHYDK